MCGIVGLVSLQNEHPVDAESVSNMAETLIHRGPDDSGVYIDPTTARCGLGFRRLSIIDLQTGHQPLSNEDQTVWVTLNGEIYNFQELRATLEKQGHRFATRSDTEVLVHLWEQHGTDMVRFLRGMFAFAIWDCKQQSLFLARDRIGQKPLFYSQHHGLFRFASELKAILSDRQFPRRVDAQAILQYLTFGYIPHPWSILKDVKKLEPAHWLLVKDGATTLQRYWRIPREVGYKGSFPDACAELREILTEATRMRMISDVPLGAFLSGGIDSTITVGLMAQLSGQPVNTFSIGFEEKEYDESEYAALVARHFNTNHKEFLVRPEALEILPLLSYHFDEPFADPSAIPTYYVSKLTRQHVTVALTGDAGDEAFGGYPRYLGVLIGKAVDSTPIIRSLSKLNLARFIPASSQVSALGRLKRLLPTFDMPAPQRYFQQMNRISTSLLADLLHPEFIEQVDLSGPEKWFCGLQVTAGRDPAAAAMECDFEAYLVGDILTKVDIASMAASLECRSPFLDHRVVEFACRLPREWRLRGFTHKYILKKAMADIIPPPILKRKKLGFAVPLVDWFRGPLVDVLRETLLSKAALSRNYFKPDAIQQLIDEHVGGRHDHNIPLWQLLMLEKWHERWAP